MNYIDQLINTPPAELQHKFSALVETPAEVQWRVLADILQKNKDTKFGLSHKFSDIRNADEFRAAVPVCDWDDIKDDSELMQNGEPDILFAGKPEYFLITSGTTGKMKMLPESADGERAKIVTCRIRDYQLAAQYPSVMNGKILSLSNSASYGITKGGIRYGTASGFTTDNADEKFLELMACPQCAKDIADPNVLDYVLMRFAIENDVRGITVNNAGRLLALLKVGYDKFDAVCCDIEKGTIDDALNIASDIRKKLQEYLSPNPQRAHELRTQKRDFDVSQVPHKYTPFYWPNLTVMRTWLGGTIGIYAENAGNVLRDDVKFYDAGYGASEGKFNIPSEAGDAAGTLATYAAFYEFIPVGDDSRSATVLAHELEDGMDYHLILTSYSGLYRYRMNDIIRVQGFHGKTPKIYFVSKTSDFLDVAGERISIEMLLTTLQAVFDKSGMKLGPFAVVADTRNAQHNFCFEENSSFGDSICNELISKIDETLREHALGYEVLRNQDIIKKPRISVMRAGWQSARYAEKLKPGISSAQIKLPLITNEIPLPEFMK